MARKRKPVTTFNPDPSLGLTAEQAQLRLDSGWDNRQRASAQLTEGQIIARNCLTFFNLVFVVLAVLLLLAGSTVKNLTFLVVVLVNAVIGCVQELRAKRAVDKLSLLAQQSYRVVRDGRLVTLQSRFLVRDDIVCFSPGDQICADGILRQGALRVNESLLTGEVDAVEKKPGDLLRSGSFVVTGTGRAQLTEVGDDAYAAKLAFEAKKDPRVAKPEMLRTLDKLIRVLGIILIPMGALLFYQQYVLLQQALRPAAEGVVAALVGMIPEGLYLLTSIALAVSALKLTKQQVLVQDMNCIETLARVDVLCVDKTGTITEPTMQVEKLIPLTEKWDAAQVLATLYSAPEADNQTGLAIARKYAGGSSWECTRYVPFESERKWIGGEFAGKGSFLAGAPSYLLGDHPLMKEVEKHAETGRRVLLVAAYAGAIPEAPDKEKVTPIALLLLHNPVREGARDTFRYFKDQGVAVKVISGDDPVTVSAVAAQAGIENAHLYIDVTDVEDFDAAVERYTVFGRVTPEKKRYLVQALKRKGHTVAMTGDGVNDVLAMKDADCAVAMAAGAQAASQVSQLVLLQNDFAAMPHIVAEGRRVINNIQRSSSLFLVKNIFALGLSLIGFLTGMPYPLMPLHMSIISGLTIGIPSFFLALEPNYARVEGKFLPTVLRRALPGGITNIFVILAAQWTASLLQLPQAQVSTLCTGLLAAVGLLVLWQVCRPFDKFRRLVWWGALTALVIAFTVLGSFLELHTGDPAVLKTGGCLLLLCPAVFFGIQFAFDQFKK